MALVFDTAFEPLHGRPVLVAPGIVRLTAPNPSPFTFTGTNTYLVGDRELAVIDPGPDLDAHEAALTAALGGRRVSHIFVSHAHKDHSGLAARLKEKTFAPVLAQGPHRAAASSWTAGMPGLEAGGDLAFAPDRELADNELVEGDGWSLRAVLTPGHAANHACFALQGHGALFSGDHVMAWATTVVAAPDGNMADYMRSLDKLIARGDRLLLPGHGGPVRRPTPFMRALKAHRRARERAILDRLKAGDRTIPELVSALYADIDPRLRAAAGGVVFAHLEDLVARRLAKIEGAPGPQAIFATGSA